MMPDIMGTDLINLIRQIEKYKNTPIIIQSGATDSFINEINKPELNITSILTKPYGHNMVVEIMKKILNNS
jgi:DNA-binding response OmpR family regulator